MGYFNRQKAGTMKETYYFPHDYEPTSDPKIGALIGIYGAPGYGIYWRLVEMLHSSDEHKLPLKNYIYTSVAKQMLTDVEQVLKIVESCINDFELFISDGVDFWSERVFRNMEIRERVSNQRSIAGKASAEKRKNSTDVQQPLTGVQQNPTKESKGNKSKGNKNKDIVYPDISEVIQYFFENGYTKDSGDRFFKYYSEANWKDSKGNKVISWKQKAQAVWFKDENKIKLQPERKLAI